MTKKMRNKEENIDVFLLPVMKSDEWTKEKSKRLIIYASRLVLEMIPKRKDLRSEDNEILELAEANIRDIDLYARSHTNNDIASKAAHMVYSYPMLGRFPKERDEIRKKCMEFISKINKGL